jgi:hypothetical protein
MNTVTDNLGNHMLGHKKNCATSADVQRFGFENLNATRSESSAGRDETRYFGGQNLNTAQGYGNMNYGATMNSAKEVLLQNSQNTMGIIKNSDDGFSSVALGGATNTASIIQSNSDGFNRASAQSSLETSHIIDKTNDGFSASIQRDASNTANIILGQTIGYKDGIINATVNANAVALQNSTNTALIQASTASGFSAVEKDIAYSKASLELLMAQNKASSDLLAVQNKASSDLLALQYAKDAQRQADENTAKLMCKIAECCCENEKLILTQNTLIVEKTNQTNALVLKLDDGRIREELTEAKLELAIAKSKDCHHHHRD